MKILAKLLKASVNTLGMSGSEVIMYDAAKGVLSATGPDFSVLLLDPAFNNAGDPRQFGLNTRQLSAAANRLSGEVDISFELASVVAKSARTSFELPTVKYESPKIESIKSKSKVPLPELKAALSYASIAADAKQKLSFQGVIWFGEKKAVATNGQMMMLSDTSFDLDLLFPAAAVAAVRELDGEHVLIGQTDTAVLIFAGDDKASTTIIARKLAREFVTWKKAVPESYSFEGRLDVEATKEALRNVTPLSRKTEAPMVDLSFSDDSLLLSSCVDNAKAEDNVDFVLDSPDGLLEEFRGLKARVKHSSVLDFFETVSGEVTVRGNDSRSPLWFECGPRKLLVATVSK